MELSDQEIMKLIQRLNLNADYREDGAGFELTATAINDDQGTPSIKLVNNSIFVDSAAQHGAPSFIEAAKPLKLKVNGTSCPSGKIPVATGDVIEWEIDNPPLFQIEIACDNMCAWFRLHSKERYAWRLREGQRGNGYLRIEAEEDRETVLHTLDIREIIDELLEQKIPKYDLEAIERELEQPNYLPILIAEGLKPVPSTDASLELLFNEKIESYFEEINGQIDFRNHLKIPSAQKGEVVARKNPMKMGLPGFDIFGNIIQPEPPKDIFLIGKKHVEITPQGEVIALKEGRPRITGDRVKFIEINPFHVVAGDVDLKTGNIFFSGDVYIYGNVTDGMIVEALGNIYITGSVFNATITATGSILIKGNIIGGKLYSGHFGVLYNRLYNFSTKLNETLQHFKQAGQYLLDVLKAQSKAVLPGQAYQLLADTKFKEMKTTAKEVLSCIGTIQNIQRNELNELKVILNRLLQQTCFLNTDPVPFIGSLQQLLMETYESIQRCEENAVRMDIPKCQLSTVMSNGDILIRKEGVLQSSLYSKNNIVFYQKDAVCKGSQLEAGDTISAMIVGGMSGGASTLKAGQKVYTQKMYDGRVFVKRFSKEIIEPVEHIQFYVSGNRLVILNDW